MKSEIHLQEIQIRLHKTLKHAVSLFREGKDSLGLKELLNSIKDLESLLDIYPYMDENCLDLDKILMLYRKLLIAMKNEDITGVADLSEFEIIPLFESWKLR